MQARLWEDAQQRHEGFGNWEDAYDFGGGGVGRRRGLLWEREVGPNNPFAQVFVGEGWHAQLERCQQVNTHGVLAAGALVPDTVQQEHVILPLVRADAC